MKTFRKFSTAKAAADGQPIIRISNGGDHLYVVMDGDDNIGVRLTEVGVISPTGYITGHVSLGHLDRLGNANHAKTDNPSTAKNASFPDAPWFKETSNA